MSGSECASERRVNAGEHQLLSVPDGQHHGPITC